MIKDIAEHNATVKSNTKELQILKQYFPSCFSGEEKFDIEAFRNRIKENVTIQEEGYELNFLGKSYAKLLASLDTDTIIVPDSEHNSLPENQESKNIYISGDNLDALKHLLNSYCGQVKCIYIDPPYNTGKDELHTMINLNLQKKSGREIKCRLERSASHLRLDKEKQGISFGMADFHVSPIDSGT